MSSTTSARGALLGFTLLCSALAGGTAFADTPPDAAQPTKQINYSDLDLTQTAGVQALYRRVAAAAKVVCQEPNIRELTRRSQYQTCFNRAVSDAVAKVNAPLLTAFVLREGAVRR